MNVIVVKAGGIGERIANDKYTVPKQFIEIKGKPLLIYSMEPFQQAKNLDRIIIACHKDYIDLCWDYVKKFNMTKVSDIVEGGETTQDSFDRGVDCAMQYMTDDDVILVGDAVRPLVASSTVEGMIEMAVKYGAAGGGVKMAECSFSYPTGKETEYNYLGNDNGILSKTPQAIKLGKYFEYRQAAMDMGIWENCPALCALSVNTGNPYKFVPDCPYNLKITYEAQLDFFRMIVENDLIESITSIK